MSRIIFFDSLLSAGKYVCMGKERDELIRRLGGTPLDEYEMSDEEILERARETYRKRGDVPPDIRSMLEEMKKDLASQKGNK